MDFENLLRESVVPAMIEWHKAIAESGTEIPFDEVELDVALAAGGAALKRGASMKDAMEVSLLGYYSFLARMHPELAPSLGPVIAGFRERHVDLLQAITEGS